MISLDVRLGWVVKVRPDHLVAHLETFVKLKPTLDTLRACNVFGRGDQAFLTKLPVELIERIGTFLVEPERALSRQIWEERFVCFKDACCGIDHYSAKEQAVAAAAMCKIEDYRHDLDSDTECLCTGTAEDIQARKLTENQLAELDEFFWRHEVKWNGLKYENVPDMELQSWFGIHEERQVDWLNTTGHPKWAARGIASSSKDICKKFFGLEVEMAHTQVANAPRSFKDMASVSTEAYLLLPAGQGSSLKLLKTFYDENLDENEIVEDGPEVENSQLLDITVPPTPTAASLRRFDRALRTLGLEAEKITTSHNLGGQEQDQSKTDVGSSEKSDVTRCKPVLKLLTRVTDDGALIG